MAIPHVGHGRDIKYGGNDAANSREISMMPGDFKQMGDKNQDMAPAKMYKEAPAKMYNEAPAKFNAGLKDAMAGKTGKFAEIVAAAPAKFYSGSGSKKGAAHMMQQAFNPEPTGPMKNLNKDMAEERIQIKDDKQDIYQDDEEKREKEGY